jgi:hypothetical protein
LNIVASGAAELSGCDYSAEVEVRRAEGEGEMNSADDPISESPESHGLPLPLTVKEKGPLKNWRQ